MKGRELPPGSRAALSRRDARSGIVEGMTSQELCNWVARLQGGERAALDELLRHAAGRLERLARHLLRAHPAVRRWAETDDVLQGALVRLARALEEVRPDP